MVKISLLITELGQAPLSLEYLPSLSREAIVLFSLPSILAAPPLYLSLLLFPVPPLIKLWLPPDVALPLLISLRLRHCIAPPLLIVVSPLSLPPLIKASLLGLLSGSLLLITPLLRPYRSIIGPLLLALAIHSLSLSLLLSLSLVNLLLPQRFLLLLPERLLLSLLTALNVLLLRLPVGHSLPLLDAFRFLHLSLSTLSLSFLLSFGLLLLSLLIVLCTCQHASTK
jgi:hypothetical protein